MKPLRTIVAAALSLAATSLSAQSKLSLQVFTSSPAGFLVNSTLVSGLKDAVLIDAQFTRSDAHRLVATIIDSKKSLTTVYVTHAHPDHYFGLEVIRQAFPSVHIVALPATIDAIKRTAQDKVAQWKPMYGEAITSTPILPTPLAGSRIVLEGDTLVVNGPVQGDDDLNSFVWIPSLTTVVAGDIVFNGVHVWTAETTPALRKRWIATLDRIAALNPTTIIAGHQAPDRGTSPDGVDQTRRYLVEFDAALASSKNAEELQAKLKSLYPALALDVILSIGAQAAFKSTK